MATLTASPGPLSITKQKVTKAYFANKVVTGSKASDEKMSYTFKGSSNNTKTADAKKNIAGIIYKNIKPDLDKNNQTTTIEEIAKALTKDSYKKPDKIEFALTKDTVRFDGITGATGASLGDELYVVVETENIPAGREIKMQFRQGGDKKVIVDLDKYIFVTQNSDKLSSNYFKAKVGEFSKENTVANASDFEHYAIAKVKLGSVKKETNKKYKEALDKAEGKKTQFYIYMDAEPEGQNYFEVKYEEVVDNRPNFWYYGEGNWFEFKMSDIWRNPIDNPQITIYTAGGSKRPWRSAFGDVRRDIRTAGLNHKGLDLFANMGTDVFACLPGTVTTIANQTGGAGHYIKIKVLDSFVDKFHELRRNYSPYYVKSNRNYDEDEYDIENYPDFIEQVGVTTSTEVHLVYFHLQSGSINVNENDVISESEYKTKVIAKTGDSGATGTKGPHLHFEIRGTSGGSRFNPAYYVNYKNETELTNAERQAQDTAAGK